MTAKEPQQSEVFGIAVSEDTIETGRAVGFHIVLWSLIFVVLSPLIWMVLISFHRMPFDTFLSDPTIWLDSADLEAYQTLFNQTEFVTWFKNSFIVSLGATALSIVICLFGAYSIGRLRFRGRGAVATFLLLTQMFPLILIAIPIFLIFRDLGLQNSILGLILAYVAFVLPFSVWMLRGFYENLPESLEEAAMIDGSTRVGAVIRVIVPLSAPAIATTAIFAWIFAWNELLLVLILIDDTPKKTLPPGLVEFLGQYTTNWDLLMAAAVGATIPLFFVFLFLQKYIIHGLSEGAVKT